MDAGDPSKLTECSTRRDPVLLTPPLTPRMNWPDVPRDSNVARQYAPIGDS